MRQAVKIYGGGTSIAPTEDDVKQATDSFREELEILKTMFKGYDIASFLDPDCDPIRRYTLLSKAAEYVFKSTQELMLEAAFKGQPAKVSFKTYFLKTVTRMRLAYDICPCG